MLEKKVIPQNDYDAEKIYKIWIDEINKKSYSFLLNKNFVIPYIYNPENNILDNLSKADDFFDSLFKVLLENPDQSHRFFFSHPPKNSFIFVLLDDYIYNLYGVRNSEVFDDDEKTIWMLKFQFDLYKKNREEKNYSKTAEKHNEIEERIIRFFQYSWYDYDAEIYTLKNLQFIHTYFSKNTLCEVEDMFFYCIYGYILSIIIVSNVANDIVPIVDFDALKEVYQDDLIFFFWAFLNHSLYCGNGFKRFDGAFDVFERRKIKDELWEKYTLWDIELFQKSIVYNEYYTQWKIKYPKVLELILDNPELFLTFKGIPYKKVFDLLLTLDNDEIISNIGLFFQERKSMKMKEKVLLFLIENIVKTNQVIKQEFLILSLKFLDVGFDNNLILSLPIELLQKVAEYNWDQKRLLAQLIENPNYLEDQEKNKILETLKFDLEFLEDDCDGKNEILDFIENASVMSVEDLKIWILSIFIQFSLEEKIAFNKKIFKNSKENISQKLRFLQLLVLSSIGQLYKKEEILVSIFSQCDEDMKFIVFIFSRLHLPEHITLKNFDELLSIILSKKKYISEIVKGKEQISIEELKEILDSKKIKSGLIYSLKDVFWTDNFDLLTEILHLNQEHLNIEKIYIILEIGKKLSEEMKEDFILHLDNFSTEVLRIMNECINLYKYFRIQYTHFHEITLLNHSPEKIQILKSHITNNVLESVKNFWEFKEMILLYFMDGNIENVKKYISELNKEVKIYQTHNEFDQKIVDIYLNGSDDEKEALVNRLTTFLQSIIMYMSPCITSTTCNSGFWPGSGTYSELLWNYFFRKMLKTWLESNDEYLKRILSLNFITLTWVATLWDMNSNFELKTLCNTYEKFSWEKAFFEILHELSNVLESIVGSTFLDLKDLQKYYNWLLKKELRKIKRSLDS